MCINCLKVSLKNIEKYEKEISDYLATLTCDCCKSYHSFILKVSQDLKVLCLTKIKRQEYHCVKHISNLLRLEITIEEKIKSKLNNIVETIDDVKEELANGHYLAKMNQIKDLYDCINTLNEADHR